MPHSTAKKKKKKVVHSWRASVTYELCTLSYAEVTTPACYARSFQFNGKEKDSHRNNCSANTACELLLRRTSNTSCEPRGRLTHIEGKMNSFGGNEGLEESLERI